MSLPVPAAAGSLPRRRRDDYAFLPAALEIIETPISPIRSSLALTLCGLIVAALALTWFGRIDVIAAAQGKIQPVGRTKIVEPLVPGRVKRIAVENGEAVQAGDLLVALDTSEIEAERAELSSDLDSLVAEAVRRNAALAGAAEPGAPLAVDWGVLPEALRQRERRVLDGDLSALAGQRASLAAKRLRAFAETERLRSTVAVQNALTSTSKQRLDMRNELLVRAAESKASVIDAQEVYENQLSALTTQKGQLGESEAALLLAQRELDQADQAFVAENAAKLADVERRIDADRQKLARIALRRAEMEIRSPVAGRIAGLSVTTPGQVLSSGEQIMQIVPGDGRVEIEAYLPNADAGFVKPGQTAVVKIEAFPFADYGTVEAQVLRVGQDAVPLAEAAQTEGNPALAPRGGGFGGVQRMQNLVFPVTLALDTSTLEAGGRRHDLVPGMAVTIEVRTGSRRILDYILAPVLEALGSAFRER